MRSYVRERCLGGEPFFCSLWWNQQQFDSLKLNIPSQENTDTLESIDRFSDWLIHWLILQTFSCCIPLIRHCLYKDKDITQTGILTARCNFHPGEKIDSHHIILRYGLIVVRVSSAEGNTMKISLVARAVILSHLKAKSPQLSIRVLEKQRGWIQDAGTT